MKWPIGALAVAGIAAGTAAARRTSPEPQRRLGVTVNLPPDEVENDARLRGAFAELAEDAETRVRPAPAARHGTGGQAAAAGGVGTERRRAAAGRP
ncbi:hypothetical protein ILP97_16245 [Amycolatopsis sp. H6(2020)]|nr:hypothetical protein [Amycolatopsis sp. H6(2020)]